MFSFVCSGLTSTLADESKSSRLTQTLSSHALALNLWVEFWNSWKFEENILEKRLIYKIEQKPKKILLVYVQSRKSEENEHNWVMIVAE